MWVTQDVNSSSNSNSSALLRVRACLSHMVSSYGSFERYQELLCSGTSCCAHEVHEGILTESSHVLPWQVHSMASRRSAAQADEILWLDGAVSPSNLDTGREQTSRVWQQCRHTRQEVQCPLSLRPAPNESSCVRAKQWPLYQLHSIAPLYSSPCMHLLACVVCIAIEQGGDLLCSGPCLPLLYDS